MSKERLSKLQKWILVEAYGNRNKIYKSQIYSKYFNGERRDSRNHGNEKTWWFPYSKYGPVDDLYRKWGTHSPLVSVGRSLKRLYEKGLIQELIYRNSVIELSVEGIEKALMLISHGTLQ